MGRIFIWSYLTQLQGPATYAKQQSFNEVSPSLAEATQEKKLQQKAFFKQLEAAMKADNEQDLLSVITQFADSGTLSSDTLVQAFSYLAASNKNTAKEKLSEYFTKPIIKQLPVKEQEQLCELLIQSHSRKNAIDYQNLKKAQGERGPFFQLLLNCLRNPSLENLETASLLVKVDNIFMSPKLLANLINQRNAEQMQEILKKFFSYEIISNEVLANLNDQAKEILAQIDLEYLLLNDEIGSLGAEDQDMDDSMELEEFDLDSNELYSMFGLLVRPKELLEQTIERAKASPESMIEACVAAIDDEDRLFFQLYYMKQSKYWTPTKYSMCLTTLQRQESRYL